MWWTALLLGCRPGPVEFAEQPIEAVSEAGEVRIPIVVSEQTSVLVALHGDARFAVDSVEGPDGVVLDWQGWLGAEQLTTAVFAQEQQTVLNWPVRASDGPLTPGDWTVVVGLYDEALAPLDGVAVEGVLRTKVDDTLDKGTVSVRVLVPSTLDEALVDGLDRALNRWERVWRRADLRLDVVVEERDLPVIVPDLLLGDPRIAAELEGESADLVLWVGEEIASPEGALGHAGSAPNARFDGAPRGVVGVAAGLAAGTDGAFSSEEVRLFGEAMAHEAGHFLGLFHPVERDPSRTDALADTPTCIGTESCEEALGGNLMFPYPICEDGQCVRAESLTEDQRGVAHRYVGVR